MQRIIHWTAAAVLCLLTPALAAPSGSVQTQPAPPDLLIPPITVKWRSINTGADVSLDGGQVHRLAGISGTLTLEKNDKRLLGVLDEAELDAVEDEQGRDILVRPEPQTAGSHRYQNPRWYRNHWYPRGPHSKPQTGIRAHLNLTRVPKRLSRVRGHGYALMAERVRTVEVTPKDLNRWIELAPGMRIKPTKLELRQGRAVLEMQTEGHRAEQFHFQGMVQDPRILRDPLIGKVWLEDAVGRAMDLGNLYRGGQGDVTRAGYHGTANKVWAGGGGASFVPMKVVFLVVLRAQEVPIPFELTDVPFPRYEAQEPAVAGGQ